MNNKTILFIGNYFVSQRSNRNVWFEIPGQIEKLGWKTITCSSKEQKILRLLDMIWTILSKRNSYQIAEVDVFSGLAFIWAEVSVKLIKLLKKPLVLMLRGGDLPKFAEKHPKRFMKTLELADCIVSPSAYLVNALSHFNEEIKIIPNPIDILQYPYKIRKNVAPKLVWVRAFHNIYNPSLAPKLVYKLINQYPDVGLVMVGPDKHDGSLEEMLRVADSLGVRKNIRVVGGVSRSEVADYLAQGDIFINTTNYDNTPVSVIEAMACGLCIVSTDVGGIPYLIDNGEDGLLVSPDDANSFGDCILSILSIPALAQLLSENAHKKALGFDWLIVVPLWDEVFKKLMNQIS